MELSESLVSSSLTSGKKSLSRWLNVVFVVTAIILLGFLALYFFWFPKLLSPLVNYVPDLKSKLTAKASLFDLDFSLAKQLPALSQPARYLVYNLDTGKVYLASGAAEKIAPASFTKILTGQVALDLGFSDELLTATRTSTDKTPTILGLRIGEQLSLGDLLRASIATSANDAAATLAEGVAVQNGINLSDFIFLMNQKSALLSMNQSHFTNPDGLDDPSQYTTLSDVAKLVNNTVKNYPPILSAAASDRKDIEKTSIHDRYYLPNWNSLLGIYPGVFGLKIAYTENAGYSTIVLAQRNNTRLAVILSGANTILNRDLAAATLLDAGFASEKIPPANINKTVLNRRYKEWSDLAKQIRSGINASAKPL